MTPELQAAIERLREWSAKLRGHAAGCGRDCPQSDAIDTVLSALTQPPPSSPEVQAALAWVDSSNKTAQVSLVFFTEGEKHACILAAEVRRLTGELAEARSDSDVQTMLAELTSGARIVWPKSREHAERMLSVARMRLEEEL